MSVSMKSHRTSYLIILTAIKRLTTGPVLYLTLDRHLSSRPDTDHQTLHYRQDGGELRRQMLEIVALLPPRTRCNYR